MKNRMALTLLAPVLAASFAAAEDFSVHLDQMANIDANRPAPAYKLTKHLDANASKQESTANLPIWIRNVYLDLGARGKVLLGRQYEAGPSKTPLFGKVGTTYACELDPNSVRAGFLRGSPDVLLVAWVEEPNPEGTSQTFSHGYVLLQFEARKVRLLGRGREDCSARGHEYYSESISSSHFAFDANTRQLVQTVAGYNGSESPSRRPLYRLVGPDGGAKFWVLNMDEKVVLRYDILDGKLAPVAATLAYKTQEGDTAAEILEHYAGPNDALRWPGGKPPTAEAILKTNPSVHSDSGVKPKPDGKLDKDQWLTVPATKEWLFMRYRMGTE